MSSRLQSVRVQGQFGPHLKERRVVHRRQGEERSTDHPLLHSLSCLGVPSPSTPVVSSSRGPTSGTECGQALLFIYVGEMKTSLRFRVFSFGIRGQPRSLLLPWPREDFFTKYRPCTLLQMCFGLWRCAPVVRH